MVKALKLLMYVLASLCFGLSYLTYNDGFFKIRPDERAMLDEAAGFIARTQAATGTLPDMSEFSDWARSMDTSQSSRYRGLQYSAEGPHLDDAWIACFGARPPGGYVLGFWNDGLNLTTVSWQVDRNRACIDDDAWNYSYGKRLPPHLLFFIAGSLLVALVFGINWLLARPAAPRRKRAGVIKSQDD